MATGNQQSTEQNYTTQLWVGRGPLGTFINLFEIDQEFESENISLGPSNKQDSSAIGSFPVKGGMCGGVLPAWPSGAAFAVAPKALPFNSAWALTDRPPHKITCEGSAGTRLYPSSTDWLPSPAIAKPQTRNARRPPPSPGRPIRTGLPACKRARSGENKRHEALHT